MSQATDVTQAELDRILADRPRAPLTEREVMWLRDFRDRCPNVETLSEVYEWFEAGKKARAQKLFAQEQRAKRYPLIFGAISALLTVVTASYHLYVFLFSSKGP